MEKKRNRHKQHLPGKGFAKWYALITLVIIFLGISYAAHTNVLHGVFHISTGSMNFIFESQNSGNVPVRMQNGSDGLTKDLGGNVCYEEKKLIISEIGPIAVEDLMDGDAIITVEYAIRPYDEEVGILRPAEIKADDDRGYDLGVVSFQRMIDTPVWSLENGAGAWGTKYGGIDRTPLAVYDFLPKDLGNFHAYNTLSSSEEGVITGTLILKQDSIPSMPDKMEVGLKELNLPEEIIDEIKSSSTEMTLNIKGTYGFTVPLDIEQFNSENERWLQDE